MTSMHPCFLHVAPRVCLQIASEALKGRVFEVSLADLQKVRVLLIYPPRKGR